MVTFAMGRPWTGPVSASSDDVLGVFPFFLGFHIGLQSKMLISEECGAYIHIDRLKKMRE